MNRASLEQDLADAEERIASAQRRIAGQRQVIAELERSRVPTDHAKYLLSGLELLLAAHRDARNRLLRELGKAASHPYSTSRTHPKAKKGVEGLTEAELLPTNRICGSGKGR
jgi:hypothetical protein